MQVVLCGSMLRAVVSICNTYKRSLSGFKTCFALQRPYLWAPPAEQMQTLRGDDLSPTALDAYELVKTFVPPVIPEVRSLLHCLGIIMATCVDGMPYSSTSYTLLLTQSAANVCLLRIRFSCKVSCLVLYVQCLQRCYNTCRTQHAAHGVSCQTCCNV